MCNFIQEDDSPSDRNVDKYSIYQSRQNDIHQSISYDASSAP